VLLTLSLLAASEDTVPTDTQRGRIEGTCFIGKTPCADQEMSLTRQGEQRSETFFTHIDSSGHYVFEDVVPGEYLVGPMRDYEEMWGKASTIFRTGGYLRWVIVGPGETVNVQVGGTGRRVIGRLVAPEGCTIKLDWLGTSDRRLSTVQPMPPQELSPDEAKKWHEAFRQSEAYTRMRTNDVTIIPDVKKDGFFSAEDVPPGEYVLDIEAGRADIAVSKQRGRVAGVVHRFTVPPGEDGSVFDLGTITAKLNSSGD